MSWEIQHTELEPRRGPAFAVLGDLDTCILCHIDVADLDIFCHIDGADFDLFCFIDVADFDLFCLIDIADFDLFCLIDIADFDLFCFIDVADFDLFCLIDIADFDLFCLKVIGCRRPELSCQTMSCWSCQIEPMKLTFYGQKDYPCKSLKVKILDTDIMPQKDHATVLVTGRKPHGAS